MKKKREKNKNQQPNIEKVLYEIIEEINTLLLLLTERTVILCLLYLSFHAQNIQLMQEDDEAENKVKRYDLLVVLKECEYKRLYKFVSESLQFRTEERDREKGRVGKSKRGMEGRQGK